MSEYFNNCVEKVLLDKDFLNKTVKRLGKEISRDYKDKNLLLLGILKGSMMFLSDLIRNINIDCSIDFMSVSSYDGCKSSGAIKISKDLDILITPYDVLIVEDILDSGRTLSYIINLLKTRNPKSLKVCTLLDKPQKREYAIKVDYLGCDIPDEFVIGYGLDYNQKYRNLPFIGVINKKLV